MMCIRNKAKTSLLTTSDEVGVSMSEYLKLSTWIAGLQWLFFLFTNIVVIPITVGAALELPNEKIITLLQLSFIVTGVGCMLQALVGHHRPIMEGQSGLWWGVFLTIVTTSSAQGVPLDVLGGSLTIGVIISGLLTMLIGLSGIGPSIQKLFNSAVMGVFLLLLGAQLIGIFFKGMLGLPFGSGGEEAGIHLPVALLSIIIVIIVIIINVKAAPSVRSYSLLIGIIGGWLAYAIIFKPAYIRAQATYSIELFPLGTPNLDIGIMITAVIAGLLNLANTSVSLAGTDHFFKKTTTNKEYRSTFTITGALSVVAGMFGLIPYAPYVSSIGFLTQTNILSRLPFILGGAMFVMLGLFPSIGAFFSNVPLSVGSAVLFVAYLLLLNTSLSFFEKVRFNSMNVYRVAIPIFVGIVIMTMPADSFKTIPSFLRPLLSNGLLVGIGLAVFLENFFPWDKIGENKRKEKQKLKSV